MKIIGCQYPIAWETPEKNFETIDRLLQAESVAPGSLLILPEMFATGFSMNVERIADLPAISFYLASLAKAHSAWVIGGQVSRHPEGKGLNQALVYSPEGVTQGIYNKIHPFSFGGEDKVYDRGNEITLIEINGFMVCPFICYDLRFPEIFRTASSRGATAFVVIANWPDPRLSHWTSLLQARAIENQAFVIGINRVGEDPKLHYSGGSAIFDPQGEVIAESSVGEGLLSGTLDLGALEAWRSRFPALQDAHHCFRPN